MRSFVRGSSSSSLMARETVMRARFSLQASSVIVVRVEDLAGFIAESSASRWQDVDRQLDFAEAWTARAGLPLARSPGFGGLWFVRLHAA